MPAYAACHLVSDQYSFGWTTTSGRSAAASTAASPTTSTGRATTAATSASNHGVFQADYINPTGLSDCSSHSGGHLGQPDGAHCSCPHGECQHFQRAQTEKKVQTSGTSSASVSQPQSPQASSWPPCQRWSRVSPSCLHSKAPTGSQGHAGHLVFRMNVDGPPAAKGPQYIDACLFCLHELLMFRSLSCLVCPCSDFICHAVVSGVCEQPGGGTQCPRISVATALDTLNFALVTERNHQSDTRVSPRAPRNSRHGLRPRIITERISSDRSRSPTRIRTRPLDTSSTWYIPALSPPRVTHRDAADSISGLRPESMLDRLPPPRPLAHLPPHSGREPGQTSPTTPDSDSDGSSTSRRFIVPSISHGGAWTSGTSTRIHYCPSQCTSCTFYDVDTR